MPAQGHCGASSKCVVTSIGILAGAAAIGFLIGHRIGSCKARHNSCHQMDCSKVVTTVDVEDIGEKKAFCRCWKSSKFPYCDGAHAQHNKETGDNLGPIIIKGKAAPASQ